LSERSKASREASILSLLSLNESVMYLHASLDPEQQEITISANVETILGYKKALFESEAMHYDALIHPDQIEQYREEEARFLQQQKTTDSQAMQQHETFSHKDYQILKADGCFIWVKEHKQYELDEYGQRISVLSVITEQAEKYNMLEQLEGGKKRLELAMKTSGIGIWEWDLESNKVSCDASWSSMMGFLKPIPAINVSRIYAMVHVDDVYRLKSALDAYIHGRTKQFQEVVRMRSLDGSWRYILNRGVIFKYNAEGEPRHFIGSHTDITDQKETELAALAALGARNHFFARVSHEIRTPMHGILGILGLLKNKIKEPESHQQLLKVEESSEQLLFLLNDILDLAKLNETKLTVSPELTSISEVILQVERLFKDKANQKKLSYSSEIPAKEHDFLMIDKVRLTQVISNLVSNSIKYTHAGFVKVSCKFISDELHLEVADSGIGINDVEKIFEPYTQEEGAKSHGSSSTGLGLEIVKKLCDLMGLSILVNSDGSGTRFSLALGRPVPPKNIKKQIPSEVISVPSNLAGKRILVVDDSEINCEIACEMLKSAGAHTERAVDGYEAVKLVSSQADFDIILMDKHMPNMNGIEATKSIFDLYEKRTAPIIIALTADAFDADNEEWFKIGLSDLITKPFDIEMLLKTVSRAMKKRARQ
jgi:signal transduction histidine kinase/ActR/RegA family two-component response regulator